MFEPGGVSMRHDELGAVVLGEEADADRANRRHDLRQHHEHREPDQADASRVYDRMPRRVSQRR